MRWSLRQDKEDLYARVNKRLRQLDYRQLKRSGRGLVRRYIAKMTGLSRAQATGLLGMYLRPEKVQPQPYRRRRFAERYTRAVAELLAAVDEAHDTISGPATRKILQGTHYDFKDAQYTRRAELSGGAVVPHAQEPPIPAAVDELPTNAAHQDIHWRAAPPKPNGQPGYLPVDTVHQGDQDGIKGGITSTQWTK
jgi:hypothetical protein